MPKIRIPLTGATIEQLRARLAIAGEAMGAKGLPAELEAEALIELAKHDPAWAKAWTEATGLAFPQSRADWFAAVRVAKIPAELFINSKIRPRELLAFLEGASRESATPAATPKTIQSTTNPGAAAPVDRPGGYMSIGELCQHFSIPVAGREAYAKRLSRLRATSADAALYRESEPDAPRDAKYLYNAADARVRKASHERPTK